MKLPPLNALHYFCIAAEHLSFSRAAAELNVTEGAVSRQMKLLASYYQKPLFRKSGRGVELTDTGRLLLSVSQSAFSNISQVSAQILADESEISICASSSFAIRCLLPNLADFERRYPQYSVQLQASTNEQSLRGKVFDVQINYHLTTSGVSTISEQKLLTEWLLPVCSPGYLPQHKPFSLGQLSGQKLLLNEVTGRDWRLWAKMLELQPLPIDSALKFEQDDVAIQAAVAGHGIALANIAYVQREMTLGSLVAATVQSPIAVGAHYLQLDPQRENCAAVQAFCLWLAELADESAKQS